MTRYRLTFLGLLLGILLCFCSCGTETLTVNSNELETLHAAEPNIAWMKAAFTAGEDGYNGPFYSLAERDGKLFLDFYDSSKQRMHYAYVNSQYLVGCDLGEYDGWVLASDFGGFTFDGEFQFEKILHENCLGFLVTPGNVDQSEIAYIFVDEVVMLGRGAIYRYENDTKPDTKLTKIVDFEGSPGAFLSDGNKIIVATDRALISVNPSDGEITTLCETEYWHLLHPNSMVKIENSYFIGATMGILEYRIDSGTVVWYPYPDEK